MSWKQPFTWKGSGRYVKTIRRFRVPAVTRLARSNRPAALAIVVLAILVMAVPFVIPARSLSKVPPSATVEGTPTLAHGEPKYVAVPREATRATRSTPRIPSEEPRAEAVAAVSTLVTVTGCLERSDDAFRLKDTSGADAPRTRSWKTGFLKKRSTSLDVVDASNRLEMNNYVGQRISLTGTLVDREMHARSLQPVAKSCESGKSAKSDAL